MKNAILEKIVDSAMGRDSDDAVVSRAIHELRRELRKTIEWVAERSYDAGKSCSDVILLQARLDSALSENKCDACGGTGVPISKIKCMCGGTGKMSDAARYLRKELIKACGIARRD